MPIRIDTNFPGGGVSDIRFLSEAEIEFSAPLDESPQSLWYCFRITGAKGKTLRLHQRNLTRVLGMFESRGYAPVVPVVRHGDGPWQRLPEGDVSFTREPLAHSFTVRPEAGECTVAFCYPYQQADFSALLAELPPQYIRAHNIGETAGGRPYTAYLFSDFEAAGERRLITLFARVHAGEVSGSYVLEGFLRALLEDPACRPLLGSFAFLVFPMVDLDSVEAGRYGKDRYPVDFNRDWSARPHHIEIRHIQAHIAAMADRYPPAAFFDLHAPQPGAPSYMPPGGRPIPGGEEFRRMWGFGLRYEAACREAGLSFHLRDVDRDVLRWGGAMRDAMSNAWLASRYECLVACFEYAYHRDAEGNLVGPEHWRALGRALLDTCAGADWDAPPADPDPARIPAWAVPETYAHWQPLNPSLGLDAREEGPLLRLTPQAPQNHIWVSSRRTFPANGAAPALEITCDAPAQLEVYFSYFRRGAFLENGRPQAWHLGAEPVRIAPEGHPLADACLAVIRAEDLPAPLTLRLGEGKE